MPRILPEIGVVIPTLGRPILKDCLQALADGTTWPAQLIIVDQSRTALAASSLVELRAKGLPIEHLLDSDTGQGTALNKGIARLRTAFVAFTDDDCLVAPDWLASMASHLAGTDRTIISGPMDPAGSQPVVSFITSRTPAVRVRPSLRSDLLGGGNWGASIAALRHVGPIDEDPRVSTATDQEYAYRALRAGCRVVYSPDVVVQHVGWRGPEERAKQYRSYGLSAGGFYGKYARRGHWIVAARALLKITRYGLELARGAAGNQTETKMKPRAFLSGLLPGLAAGLASDRSALTARAARPRSADEGR